MAIELKLSQQHVKLLKEKIDFFKKEKGPLMPVLHEAQKLFGCVPLEVQKIISEGLDISVAKINGVVTFYSHFTIEPKGKHVVSICSGTACYVRGAQTIIDAICKELNIKAGQTTEDGMFTLDTSRCIGACGLAPVFTVGDEVYGKANADVALEVIERIKKTEGEKTL